MTYSRLREELLMALYQEQSDEGTNDIVSFKKLVDEYDLDWKPGWLIEAQKDLRGEGLINGPSNGNNDDMAVGRLSGQGLRYIEEKYGDLDGVSTLLVKKGWEDQLVPVPPANPARGVDYARSAAPTPSEASTNVLETDSSNWTGKQFVLVDAKVIATVQKTARELHTTIYAMRFESNEESFNLKGLADALVAICEMAEPDVTIIDRILASPKFKAYASLLALVATIRGAIGI